MGNKQTGPCVDKKTEIGSNNKLKFACCEMQGWREYMVNFNLDKLIFFSFKLLTYYVLLNYIGRLIIKYN
jgi:hypothetical protein